MTVAETGIGRVDRRQLWLLFGLGLALEVATSWLGIRGSAETLSSLGVYFDGHLYLEIARSFPLPYAPEGPDYLGQAPGYPAVLYLARILTPDAYLDWGLLAVGCSWIAGALCGPAFYRLASLFTAAPLWPSLLFITANPRWVPLSAAAHPEPLAMLFCILGLSAFLRESWPRCGLWFSLAALTRFPSVLLVVPLGLYALYERRGVRALAWLATPALSLVALHVYLRWRVPDFLSVFDSHQVFWNTEWTLPFRALIESSGSALWSPFYPDAAITYAFVAIYLIAIALGLRPNAQRHWLLSGWVATIVLFHASLSQIHGAIDFTRLAILAWPAAVLIFWHWIGRHMAGAPTAFACAVMAIYGIGISRMLISSAIPWQFQAQPFLEQARARLNSDEPHWVDFQVLAALRP